MERMTEIRHREIYKWQQGAAIPTIDNLIVLSVIFGVSLDEIIVLEDACRIKTA